jgi:hypothetical protein
MAKFISDNWKVVVNSKDLSVFADSVDTPQTKDQVDVSGFGGTREFIPGIEDAELTVEFLQGFGTNEPHDVLYPLYSSGTTFSVYVQPFRGTGTTSANPIYGGTASLYEYNGGAASLNDPSKFSATFKPAPNSKFTWGTVAP